MHHETASTCFLHVFDVESGLWAEMTLASVVSPRLREAMNLILQEDGILGFTGTRSEFGVYYSNLKRDNGTDFRHSWTSLPGSTILSMLGLCLNMPISGRPELVFDGSPRILMLAYLLELKELQLLDIVQKRPDNAFVLTNEMLHQIGAYPDVPVVASEYQEALSYLRDSTPLSDPATIQLERLAGAS